MSQITQHWLALRFTHLPLEVLGLSQTAKNPAIVDEDKNVLLCNTAAKNLGISPGMPSAAAILLGDIEAQERHIDLEKQVLKNITTIAYQYSPHLEFIQTASGFSDQGVILEISRCLSLFQGFERLLTTLKSDFESIQHAFSVGLAHTAQGAWLSSFLNKPMNRLEERSVYLQYLGTLPLSKLLQCRNNNGEAIATPKDIENLHNTGFIHLADVLQHITQSGFSGFQKRWRTEFIELLQDILDTDTRSLQTRLFQKPTNTYTPESHFYDQIEFEFPHTNTEHIGHAMKKLLQNLCDYLRNKQQSTQTISWQLFDIHQNKHQIQVQTSQDQSNWQTLWQLSMIQLEHESLPFEVDCLELICQNTRSKKESSTPLIEECASDYQATSDFDITTTKLQARLGQQSLFKVSYQDTHIPEDSYTLEPINKPIATPAHLPEEIGPRPTWLLKRALPILKRSDHLYWRGKLSLTHGPERIEGNWWQTPVARDYFIATRDDHVRVWIYYDLQTHEWFAHGVFG